MVVRELIHLQQGPQDQLPVQPFSFPWRRHLVISGTHWQEILLGPGAESSALPLPSLPGFTGYDAVQNRFSGQVGVNFKTLVMGHNCTGLSLSLADSLQTLTLTFFKCCLTISFFN